MTPPSSDSLEILTCNQRCLSRICSSALSAFRGQTYLLLTIDRRSHQQQLWAVLPRASPEEAWSGVAALGTCTTRGMIINSS
ncbi:hypothetical protein WJX84_009921 [Apatococcus fuscideae]|uniref:Uncharacterized protein n=1 Tax=Apatococcus fuscideae TaxID=2026836 RepID=A0AAW1SBA2_9CHLO